MKVDKKIADIASFPIFGEAVKGTLSTLIQQFIE